MDSYFKFSTTISSIALGIVIILYSLSGVISIGRFVYYLDLFPIVIFVIIWAYLTKRLAIWVSNRKQLILRIYSYLIAWFIYIWVPYAYYDFFLKTGWFSGMGAIVFGIGGLICVLVLGPIVWFAIRHELNPISKRFLFVGRFILFTLSLILPLYLTIINITGLSHLQPNRSTDIKFQEK